MDPDTEEIKSALHSLQKGKKMFYLLPHLWFRRNYIRASLKKALPIQDSPRGVVLVGTFLDRSLVHSDDLAASGPTERRLR